MKSRKRILIVTANALPSVTGNAITAERWRRSLVYKRFVAEVLPSRDIDGIALVEQIEHFKPDLIHVHNLFRAGRLLLHPAMAPILTNLPMVASPAGTDINIDVEMPDRRDIVLKVCRMARAIVAQGRETLQRLMKLLPGLRDHIVMVPKAFFWLGYDPYDLRKAAGSGPGDILFFMPGGIRPVKGNLECFGAMEKVHAVRPQVRVVFAGPALDPKYTARFEKEVRRLSDFARWIPLIPPEAMRSAYKASDVVLNASFAEGLSNSLLEAIATGRPVLASNIPGNRWPVLGEAGDQPAGYLFDLKDPDDFVRYALKLIDEERLRRGFGQAGRLRASRWPTTQEEAVGLIAAYKIALGEP